MQENNHFLSDPAQAFGKGAHGINRARGLGNQKKLSTKKKPADLKDVFKTAGMTMVSKVGGASGPLYGTAFLNMSKAVDADTIDAVGLTKVIEAGLEGIEKRGKSHAGEKTMIDVWEPVVHALHQEDLTDDVVDAALQKTKDLKATKGRASYLGERSIGHLDPGAYSSALLFHAMLQTEVS
ncbi:dihydroxyacetone kinase subunit DhaL [Listeria monocytogenes]|uniref:dihydroxyacetone kinase subunit DhaL n=1 Tax=Listeria monocytogenes TaxID=1639 RepID=UPI0034A45FD4